MLLQGCGGPSVRQKKLFIEGMIESGAIEQVKNAIISVRGEIVEAAPERITIRWVALNTNLEAIIEEIEDLGYVVETES